MLSRNPAPQTHGKPPRTAFLLVLEFVRESSSTGRTCAALPCSRPAPGIEANGFYFELLGARGPQNKNRLLFHWIFQTRRPRPMQKSHPRQEWRQTVFILSSLEPEGLKIKTVCLVWSGCWISWACCVVLGGVPPQENHRRVSSHRLRLKEEAVSGDPSRYGDGSPGTACSLLLLLFRLD